MKITALIYRFAITAIACLLPFGRYVSIFIFLAVICWILEGDFRAKMQTLQKRPYIILFALLPLLLAIGFFYSEDKGMALLRLKISLPLLVFPLITATSGWITDRFRDIILLVFVLAVMVAVLAGVFSFYAAGNGLADDPRQMALFMTHIRFSLLVNFAIAVIMSYCLRQETVMAIRISGFVTALALTVFLFLLGSLTGIVILAVLMMYFLYRYMSAPGRLPRLLAIAAGLLPAAVAAAFIIVVWVQNFTTPGVETASPEKYTANGNPYFHDTASGVLENRNYTDMYISEKEMRAEWNRVSDISFDSHDLKGQDMSFTLRRYLTSKGLAKDSAGVNQLTLSDIEAIEKGVANYRFIESSFLFRRVYETLWEIHVYLKSGYVKEHSFAQRLAFWESSLQVAADNIVMGTGTGDAMNEIRRMAEGKNLVVDVSWEGKPHNQLLYYLSGSGLPVLLIIIFSWIWPLAKGKKIRNPLVTGFLIVSWLSMLTLDTLESHDSVIFYAFFYSLLILRDDDEIY